MKRLIFVFVFAATVYAQDAPKPLTDVQKLQIQNASQSVEIWKLRLQQAATEYEKANVVLQKLITTVTPDGYEMNDKLEFVKKPLAKKEGQ